jgi:hypothetical protein
MFEEFPELGLDKAKCTEIWKHIINDDQAGVQGILGESRSAQSVDPLHDRPDRQQDFHYQPSGRPAPRTEHHLSGTVGRHGAEVLLAAEKGPVAADARSPLVVDDYYKNCFDIKAAVPSCYVAMLYTPYNKVHHADWLAAGGEIVLSVDQFVLECNKRGLITWQSELQLTRRHHELCSQ